MIHLTPMMFIYLLLFSCHCLTLTCGFMQTVTGQHAPCHTWLHAFRDCADARSPPCEAVAKLRLGNRFSVAKLVT